MPEIKQFAITLFNLKLWDKDKVHRSTRTDEWMDGRIALFEKYCFPAMSGQTLKDFTWICLFDKDTPDRYTAKIESLRKICPQLTPVFFSEEQAHTLGKSLHNALQQYLAGDEKFIISTNVDNDDAVRSSMLERVRKEVLEKKETGLYNCIYGIQYFASKRLAIKMMYPNNHFQSICETPSDFRTVSGFPHTRVRKMFLNHDIKEDKTPYWMEVVHGHNVNNSFRVDVRLKNILPFKQLNLNEFGSDITLSSARNTMNSLFRVPLMFIQTACNGIWRHFLKSIGKYKYTPREFKFPDAE